MGFTVHWSEEDIEEAANEYSYQIADVLEKKLVEKERQLKWVESPAEVSRRVHNTFGLGELHIAEIRFNLHGGSFRTLFHILSDREALVYIDTVGKKNQKRMLRNLKKRSSEVREYLIRKYDQSSS